MKLLVPLLAFLITPSQGVGRMDAPFVADIFASLPTNFDPSIIRSAQDYVLLQQVLRMPIQISKSAQIEGDFLKSWRIDEKHKIYTLTLKENLLWSDKKKITAEDFVNSIERQIRLKSATHFNFSQIQKIEIVDTHTVKIFLKESNTRFLKQLAYPEFGLVRNHKKDLLDCDDLKVSSGPYKCESFIPNKSITLVKNSHYEITTKSPERIVIQSSPVEVQLDGLKGDKINLVIPSSSISQVQYKDIERNSKLQVYDPHIGFTFWISLNSKSKIMSSKSNRKYIQSVLSGINIDFKSLAPFWQAAKQLYLPGGFGRPSSEKIGKIWNEIAKSPSQEIKKLSLLVSKKFLFTSEIVKALKNKNIELDIEYYADLNEFTEKQKNSTYDLVQINNDFSSVDVSENLLVTFNQNRPLIFVGKDEKKYSSLLNSIISSSDPDLVYSQTQDIGVELLEDAYIFPVAYYMTYFYLHKNVDISAWSQLFPDIKFWKVSISGQ